MHAFFKGWRRKLGYVALVMALAVMGGWLRSFRNNDEVNIWSGERQVDSFNSSPMGVSWIAKRDLPPSIPMLSGRFGWIAFQSYSNDICDPFRWSTASSHTQWCGFHFAEATINPPDRGKLGLWIMPYWSLALPPTLLSAYLILWPRRQKSTQPDSSPRISN
jgi:hypothetical protein